MPRDSGEKLHTDSRDTGPCSDFAMELAPQLLRHRYVLKPRLFALSFVATEWDVCSTGYG